LLLPLKDIKGPHHALELMDQRIKKALHQVGDEKEAKDGMDIALCAVHMKKNTLQYCGAHRPCFVARDGELIEFKPTRVSIGGYNKKGKEFKEHSFDLKKGDCIYLFSDGYTDQFGGKKHKKFLLKRFKELLVAMNGKPMEDQKTGIENAFDEWKGEHRQVDDVCVMGIRVT